MDASRSTPQTQLNPERFTEKRPARILQLGLAADGPLTSARWGTSQVKSNISSCTAVVEGSLDASRVCIVISNPGSNQAHWDLEPMAGSEMGIAPAGCNVDVVAPPGTHFVFVPRAELAHAASTELGMIPGEGQWPCKLATDPVILKELRQLLTGMHQEGVPFETRNQRGELIIRLIARAALHGTTARTTSQASVRADQLRLARTFIEDNFTQSLAIETVAEAAAVGVRTLQRRFKDVFDTTPLTYIRAVRLHRVRLALQTAEPGTQVARVALANGLTHMGRFSQEYRRLFDELPRQTLARAGSGQATQQAEPPPAPERRDSPFDSNPGPFTRTA